MTPYIALIQLVYIKHIQIHTESIKEHMKFINTFKFKMMINSSWEGRGYDPRALGKGALIEISFQILFYFYFY